MRTTLFYALALFVSAGCSSSKYQIVEPKPQLSLSTVATVCELGQAVSLTLAVSQEGVDGNFSLSAFIREGKATLTLDGSDMGPMGAALGQECTPCNYPSPSGRSARKFSGQVT